MKVTQTELFIPKLLSADGDRLHRAIMPIVVPSYYDLNDPDHRARFEEFKVTLANQIRQADDFPLLVVDASPNEFHSDVRSAALDNEAVFVDLRGHGGLARQNLTGLTIAQTHAEFAGRIEGEKSGLVAATNFHEIVELLRSGTRLVCLGRDYQAMTKLPHEQHVVEAAMNRFGRDVYGLLPDPSCGPRFFGPEAMVLLKRFDIFKYPQWQWQLGLLMDLMVRDEPVEQYTTNLLHPKRLRDLEQGNPVYIKKRKEQAAAMLEFINTYAANIGLPIRG